MSYIFIIFGSTRKRRVVSIFGLPTHHHHKLSLLRRLRVDPKNEAEGRLSYFGGDFYCYQEKVQSTPEAFDSS